MLRNRFGPRNLKSGKHSGNLTSNFAAPEQKCRKLLTFRPAFGRYSGRYLLSFSKTARGRPLCTLLRMIVTENILPNCISAEVLVDC